MRQFKGSTDYWVKVKARFMIDSNGAIDYPSNYNAVLFDKNPITESKIGTEFLGRDGSVKFEFPLLESIRCKETPFESKPDLFIRLYRKDRWIYTTKVFNNVDFFIYDDNRRRLIQNTVNLGTFKVKVRDLEYYQIKETAS